MKQLSYLFIAISLFALMLCFPMDTFTGARNGLLLWFQIILPTLLPFLIFSNFLIHTNSVTYISQLLKPFLKSFFRISAPACYAVLIGFLCGYPMGAKVISDLIITNRISRKEGAYLLSFCNNTSPMFIISYIVMQTFRNRTLLIPTVMILFLAPVLCSFFFRKYYGIESSKQDSAVSEDKNLHFNFQIFDTCIMNGFETITKVGGYILLFSILFSLGKYFPAKWLLPFLEISNGIPFIMHLGLSFPVSYIFVLALTSFGGLCSIAQTFSMIQQTGLSIFPYIIQKLITTLVTSFLALLYIMLILQ